MYQHTTFYIEKISENKSIYSKATSYHIEKLIEKANIIINNIFLSLNRQYNFFKCLKRKVSRDFGALLLISLERYEVCRKPRSSFFFFGFFTLSNEFFLNDIDGKEHLKLPVGGFFTH
jgi:hypothetical protein